MTIPNEPDVEIPATVENALLQPPPHPDPAAREAALDRAAADLKLIFPNMDLPLHEVRRLIEAPLITLIAVWKRADGYAHNFVCCGHGPNRFTVGSIVRSIGTEIAPSTGEDLVFGGGGGAGGGEITLAVALPQSTPDQVST